MSPIMANVKIEDFEVDDTFTILHQYATKGFNNHVNFLDPHIKFTIEKEQDGQLPFLDTCVLVTEDGSLKTKFYHKPTNTDHYLNWVSIHHLEHKRSLVHTLLRRAETVVSQPSDREEVKHVKTALAANGYMKLAFEILKKREKVEDPSKFLVYLNNSKGYSRPMESLHTTNISTL